MDFHQVDGRDSGTSSTAYHLSICITRRVANKKFDSQSTNSSDKILPSSTSRSRFYSKSKEIGINTISEFHVHRRRISDAIKFSQGSRRVQTLILTIKSILSCKQVLARSFLSLLGKLTAAADFVYL